MDRYTTDNVPRHAIRQEIQKDTEEGKMTYLWVWSADSWVLRNCTERAAPRSESANTVSVLQMERGA
jgi:hypothetical protein